MDRGNKKRVAHVVSKSNSSEINDMVAEVMKTMNADKAVPKLYSLLKSPSSEGSSGQNSNGIPSTTQPRVAPQQQKKFSLAKRHHPLMEKAQKSKNYIKHNRSIPKPRAHVGGLSDIVQTLKSKSVFAKSGRNKSDFFTKDSFSTLSDENISDVSSDCRKSPVLSSDSESDFESFIRTQKHDIDWDEQNFKRKRKLKKKSTKHKAIKQTKGSAVTSRITATNRRKLTETSDSSTSSADENELRGTRKVSTIPLFENNEIESCKKIDTNCLTCTVSIERIPHLDETVTLLNPPLEDNGNENIECSSKLQESETIAFTGSKDKTTLHSDDECMIIYEAPKCNHTDDTCDTKMGNTESDIMIVNVVSLEENQKIAETNDGNLYGVDFEISKEPNLPSINSEIITEDHWLNLKKAVSLNNCFQYELPTTSELLRGNIENIGSVKTPLGEPSASISDLSASDLKEIISKANENTSQGKNTIKLQSKKDCCENACDDLDILGTRSIQDLCRNQNSQNILKLLHVYKQNEQEYNQIENSEDALSYSLQFLKESSLARNEYFESVLMHLMKHDPGFLTAQNNNKSLFEIQEREVSLKQVKKFDKFL